MNLLPDVGCPAKVLKAVSPAVVRRDFSTDDVERAKSTRDAAGDGLGRVHSGRVQGSRVKQRSLLAGVNPVKKPNLDQLWVQGNITILPSLDRSRYRGDPDVRNSFLLTHVLFAQLSHLCDLGASVGTQPRRPVFGRCEGQGLASLGVG